MSTLSVTVAIPLVPTRPAAAGAYDRAPAGDQRLVEAARAGDREAFDQLVTLHGRAVYRTALAALCNPDEAEEAAQDAFVVAWQRLRGFRRESAFRTWLLTIAWRKALDRRRKWTRRWARVAQAADAGPDPVDLLRDLSPDPEQHAVAADLLRHARLEIDRLSPKLRDTLLLAATGTHSYDDIGELLAIPVGTVKWRVAEARRLLGERLSGRQSLRGPS
ncbi:MAG TPA: RNA polymerase sigma factor [Vicinamibacterales bacterium]|nr:RNA polymerase sigma factor [Vicinamibacterales bacterium]